MLKLPIIVRVKFFLAHSSGQFVIPELTFPSDAPAFVDPVEAGQQVIVICQTGQRQERSLQVALDDLAGFGFSGMAGSEQGLSVGVYLARNACLEFLQ